MSEVQRCQEQVGEPPGYWHWHTCNRPVKVAFRSKGGTVIQVCGVHARSHPFTDRKRWVRQ